MNGGGQGGGIERERGKLEVQQKRNLRKHACLRIGVCVCLCVNYVSSFSKRRSRKSSFYRRNESYSDSAEWAPSLLNNLHLSWDFGWHLFFPLI